MYTFIALGNIFSMLRDYLSFQLLSAVGGWPIQNETNPVQRQSERDLEALFRQIKASYDPAQQYETILAKVHKYAWPLFKMQVEDDEEDNSKKIITVRRLFFSDIFLSP